MKKKGNEKIGKEREKSIAERFAEELVEEIKEDFKERQQARRPYELSWQLNMNFLAGNQYCSVAGDSLVEDEKSFEWQEKQVFNHIAPVYETRLAKLSRVRPKMTVRPFTDEDKDVNSAKLAKKILESCSEKLSVNGIIDKGTMWSEACGTVFYKIVWDKEKGVKIKSDDKVYTCGDVSVSVVPPFEIYPDSSVCADLDECKSIIHAKAYSSAEVKEIWGADVKGEELKVFSLDGGVSMGGRSYNKTAPGVTEQVKKDAVLVIERYTRPTKQNPDGELTVVAGDVLVYSGPLPYRNGTDGERDFPFVRQVSILWAGCFWGVSMIERLVPLQRAYNAVKCRKHEFLNRISMGVLAVEDGSIDTDLVDGEWLTPGKVLVYRQGANLPRLLSSGSVPDDFNLEEQRLLAESLQVSGVSEFMRNSKTQTGLTSGVALQLLIEQDDTRLAVSAEQIRGAIKTVGQHILRLYKQFATAARLEKVVGDNGSIEVFYFSGSDISSDDVVFETENDLNETPASRKSMVMDLLNAGLLSDETGRVSPTNKVKILEMMGFGNWETAQNLNQLHVKKAERENLRMTEDVVPLDIDNHEIHIDEHVRFVISGQAAQTGRETEEAVLKHIRLHKAMLSDLPLKTEEGA